MPEGVDIAVEPKDLKEFGQYLREMAGTGADGALGLETIRARLSTVAIPDVDPEVFPGTDALKATVHSTRESIMEELAQLSNFFNELGADLEEASELYRNGEDMAQASMDELGKILAETSDFIDKREAKLAKEEEEQTGQSDIADERSQRNDDKDGDGRSDNPNIDENGNVKDENADGDKNGVKDGIQYVDGDADLNDDGELDEFEKEYGDKDDDGKVDNRDDAEANDLEVDEDPPGEEDRELDSREAEEREYEERQEERRVEERES
ncbi:hypothetical protein ABT342_23750, partial [Streptomyces sp. NPDC000410]